MCCYIPSIIYFQLFLCKCLLLYNFSLLPLSLCLISLNMLCGYFQWILGTFKFLSLFLLWFIDDWGEHCSFSMYSWVFYFLKSNFKPCRSKRYMRLFQFFISFAVCSVTKSMFNIWEGFMRYWEEGIFYVWMKLILLL